MSNWEYKVSVIVPVYNVEKWLRGCIESLLAQTIDREEMEILLIDDGTPDGSGAICDEYAELYPETVKVWHKENEGLGSTRNYGIKRAKGKYLMFIDSDDEFSPGTVKACTDFFDINYIDIDMVTYKEQPYKNGLKLPLHFRYNYLTKTGIYDLNDKPYITQTRVNICVKNLGENSPMFDIRSIHEDQMYCMKILMDKMKIGYVSEGEYKYNKDNDTSLMNLVYNPIHMIDIATTWYEYLFALYSDHVPAYIQALFVHDCNWKLKQNVLFPYHYEDEEFDEAVNRLKCLWTKVDVETLIRFPGIDTFHKHFWINMKENANITISAIDKKVDILTEGKIIYSRANFEIILKRCVVRKGRLDFIAYLKSPIFNYIEENARIFVVENNNFENKILLDINLADESMYHCRTYTNRFFEFRYRPFVESIREFRIVVEYDGFYYDTVYWFSPKVYFIHQKAHSFLSDRTNISFNNGIFKLTPKVIKTDIEDSSVTDIWLYSDATHVEKDNGYYQFIHDFDKSDNILRYYVTSVDKEKYQNLFSLQQMEYVIERNSDKHKEIYLNADKVLTAFVNINDMTAASPFTKNEEKTLIHKIKHEVIYLQHGILHANYRQAYSLETNIANKIVVSTKFEMDNFINNYNYSPDDLIPVGMPRYDLINYKQKPQKKILFAPSWRAYFAIYPSEGEWGVKIDKLSKSNYFKGIMSFISSKEIISLLEKYNFSIDIKLHPIASHAALLFSEDVLPERVKLVDSIREEDYAVFITDFSSYVFDFVYLKRPIVYFVPDYKEFRCGMNAYRKLDLEFEDAFGPLTVDYVSATERLADVLKNGCNPEEVYRKRMENFFLFEDSDCRERLYEFLIKN